MAAKKPIALYSGDKKEFQTGDFLDVANGGTGATTAAGARTNLGLANDLTAGTGISFNTGTTYNGTAAKTISTTPTVNGGSSLFNYFNNF